MSKPKPKDDDSWGNADPWDDELEHEHKHELEEQEDSDDDAGAGAGANAAESSESDLSDDDSAHSEDDNDNDRARIVQGAMTRYHELQQQNSLAQQQQLAAYNEPQNMCTSVMNLIAGWSGLTTTVDDGGDDDEEFVQAVIEAMVDQEALNFLPTPTLYTNIPFTWVKKELMMQEINTIVLLKQDENQGDQESKPYKPAVYLALLARIIMLDHRLNYLLVKRRHLSAKEIRDFLNGIATILTLTLATTDQTRLVKRMAYLVLNNVLLEQLHHHGLSQHEAETLLAILTQDVQDLERQLPHTIRARALRIMPQLILLDAITTKGVCRALREALQDESSLVVCAALTASCQLLELQLQLEIIDDMMDLAKTLVNDMQEYVLPKIKIIHENSNDKTTKSSTSHQLKLQLQTVQSLLRIYQCLLKSYGGADNPLTMKVKDMILDQIQLVTTADHPFSMILLIRFIQQQQQQQQPDTITNNTVNLDNFWLASVQNKSHFVVLEAASVISHLPVGTVSVSVLEATVQALATLLSQDDTGSITSTTSTSSSTKSLVQRTAQALQEKVGQALVGTLFSSA